jgi:mono/diheme cytochrome c family protein
MSGSQEEDGDAQSREFPDPVERDRPIPKPLLAGVAALFLWAVGYIVWTQRDDPPALGDSRTVATLAGATGNAQRGAKMDGAALYAAQCAACHQANGAGLPGVFPPLARSEWVTGSPNRLAQVVLHGVSGPLTVAGSVFNGQMPPFRDKLDDASLAAVLTHVRTQFGNAAGPVAERDVAAARAASASRDQPWKGDDELSTLQ